MKDLIINQSIDNKMVAMFKAISSKKILLTVICTVSILALIYMWPSLFLIALFIVIPLIILNITCKEQMPEIIAEIRDIVMGFAVLIAFVFIVGYLYTGFDNIVAHFKTVGEVKVYPIWSIENELKAGGTWTFQAWVRANKVLVKADNGVSNFSPLPSNKCVVNDIYNWVCYDADNYTMQMVNKKYSDNVPLSPWAKSDDEPVAYVSWWEWYLLKYLSKGRSGLINLYIEEAYKLKLPTL